MPVNPHDLIRLRIMVLCLGESQHANWWRSQFLSPTGLSYLAYPYPRSTFAAAVRSATQAAQLVHDEAIGRGQVFHLFRLPRAEERQMTALLQTDLVPLREAFEPIFTDRSALMAALLGLAGQEPPAQVQGPVRLAFAEDRWIRQLATLYAGAFAQSQQVFPYLEAQPA
jgi:hypothetical protein